MYPFLIFSNIQKSIISLLLLVALPAYSETTNICGSDYQITDNFSSIASTIDWGLKIHSIKTIPDNAVSLEPVIEYEYGKRVVYEEDPVSLNEFWKKCESFIGRQQDCNTGEDIKFLSDYETLTNTLISQGSIINKYPESLMSFPYPSEYGSVFKGRPENMFNLTLLKEDMNELGDFRQVGYRQAIRYKWTASQFLDEFQFDKFEVPLAIYTPYPGIYVNSKSIFKVILITNDSEEPVYGENRVLLEDKKQPWCDGAGCIATFYDTDILTKEEINRLFTLPFSNEGGSCTGTRIENLDYMEGNVISKINAADEIIFHYEVQVSIININAVNDFDPKNFMARDTSLPETSSGGGALNYLFILIAFLLARPRRSL